MQSIKGIMKKEEIKLTDQLEIKFNRNGWDTFREVIPDQCKDWDFPYRVDLIVHKPEYGYIGIECKHISSHNSGGIYAKAHYQIVTKYRDKTYFEGTSILKWAICPFVEAEETYRKADAGVRVGMREFFSAYGIGYIDLGRAENLIDYAYSCSWAKIPIGTIVRYQDRSKIVDIEKIEKMICKKMKTV